MFAATGFLTRAVQDLHNALYTRTRPSADRALLLRPVRFQRRPIKLVATTARHVVAATTLLDLYAAGWACLQHARHICTRTLSAYGKPLVLTKKTHDSVETQIAQSDATKLRAFHLHLGWVKRVPLKPSPLAKRAAQVPRRQGSVKHMRRSHHRLATRVEAACLQTSFGGTARKLHVDPASSAHLARSVAAGVTLQSGSAIVFADGAVTLLPVDGHAPVSIRKAIVIPVDLEGEPTSRAGNLERQGLWDELCAARRKATYAEEHFRPASGKLSLHPVT
mmetsp:Transcript_27857/g.77005  ORF Transcript_27857/g.77005 Transcript_27857/m.77005 type:complete len:278 (-) Transcript_27857:155-988(-)